MTEYEIHESCQMDRGKLQGIYQRAFGGYRTEGTFVEVGAYDGRSYSFTWGLARAGWRGLYVEARPDFAERCREVHAESPNVKVAAVACGQRDGECDLYLHGVESSIRLGKVSKAWGCTADSKIRVPVRRLDTLLEERDWPPEYDLLIVDVEDAEEQVLRGYSMHRWRPRVAIIETHERYGKSVYTDDKGRNRTAKFAWDYFRPRGYDKVYADKINTIFVRRMA